MKWKPEPGTKRALDAAVRDFLHPKPMSIEQALASDDPLSQIDRRLIQHDFETLTPPEQMFRAASYFLGDTLNGGLIQTLTNSTGDHAGIVAAFADEFCDPAVRLIFDELRQMFPGGSIPEDRDERSGAIDVLSSSMEADPFDSLTDRLYALEEEFREGLLQLASQRQADFVHMVVQGKR
jgi:hypothetical protein